MESHSGAGGGGKLGEMFFFVQCFIPSRCADGIEAHPTRLPKFTAPAETQEASGADLPARFSSACNPRVRRRK